MVGDGRIMVWWKGSDAMDEIAKTVMKFGKKWNGRNNQRR